MLSNLQAIVFKYKHINLLYCFITMKQMFLPNEKQVFQLGRNRFYLVCIFQRSCIHRIPSLLYWANDAFCWYQVWIRLLKTVSIDNWAGKDIDNREAYLLL